MPDKHKEKKSKNQSAEEIAEIMVQNMIENMKNPNFLEEKERRLQEAAAEVNAERIKRKAMEEDEDISN